MFKKTTYWAIIFFGITEGKLKSTKKKIMLKWKEHKNSNSIFQFQLLANAEFVGYKYRLTPKALEASQMAN